MLEGTDRGQTGPKWYLILVPVFFFVKRLLFIGALVLANAYLWVQVALLMLVALGSAVFMLQCMPLESRKANLFEVFNECTLLVLTYLLWCFTQIIGEPETRHLLGYAFIGASLGNVGVHLLAMLLETAINARLRCKRRAHKRPPKEEPTQEEPPEEETKKAKKTKNKAAKKAKKGKKAKSNPKKTKKKQKKKAGAAAAPGAQLNVIEEEAPAAESDHGDLEATERNREGIIVEAELEQEPKKVKSDAPLHLYRDISEIMQEDDKAAKNVDAGVVSRGEQSEMKSILGSSLYDECYEQGAKNDDRELKSVSSLENQLL